MARRLTNLRCHIRVALVLMCFLMPSASAYAAAATTGGCDGSLRPSDDPDLAYRKRFGDPRCEGTYEARIGAPFLQILSCIQGRAQYALDRDAIISVPAPSLDGLTSTNEKPEVWIRAVALQASVYYRMDAILPEGKAFSWPVYPVLFKLGLSPDRIGALGWTEADDRMVLLPLRLAGSPTAAASGSRDVTIIVRTSERAERIRWREVSDQGTSPWTTVGDRLSAGDWVEVVLKAGDWSPSRGIRRIEVEAANPPPEGGTDLITGDKLTCFVARPGG